MTIAPLSGFALAQFTASGGERATRFAFPPSVISLEIVGTSANSAVATLSALSHSSPISFRRGPHAILPFAGLCGNDRRLVADK
jgi:hypothetical protein